MGANLKEVRTRIKSVMNTQQITKAMKMVSAAKLRRAQQAIQQMRPYAKKLNAILSDIVTSLDKSVEIPQAVEREVNKVLIVLVTSSRGLCGAFNSYLIKDARTLIQEKYNTQYEAGNVSMMYIGKKGDDFYRRRFNKLNKITEHVELFTNLSFDNTARVSQSILDAYENGEYDAVEVIYSEFKNAAVQYNKTERYLPIAKIEPEEDGDKQTRADFIFEPSMEQLLHEMVPSILRTQFHSYLLDTHASEHGARMTAMDKATENADELLKELRINYNKARQEAITRELTEIVSGAAALEG
ncbi:MAG: ATP synthase F1 subunit gamma [Bacteroidota bacterium]